MTNRRGMCCSLAVLAMACFGIELLADDAPYHNQPYHRADRGWQANVPPHAHQSQPTNNYGTSGSESSRYGSRPGVTERRVKQATFDVRSRVVRLPPVNAVNPPSWREFTRGAARHGTWRQNGDEMVINLNGQQYRLEKIGEDRPSSGGSAVSPHSGGEVRGRLSHQGKPLAHCTVALLSLNKSFGGYTVSRDAEPLTTTTNYDGTYHFDEVAPGPYKLKWRPQGVTYWIRRAEFRPDVRVRTGETSRVKEIRVALRTLN